MRQKIFYLIMVPVVLAMLGSANSALAGSKTGKIIHDAEHYILEAQHGKKMGCRG
jgi:hypothetical protein